MIVGKVLSGASTSHFDFVITNAVLKNQYVYVQDNGLYVGMVTEITKQNPYFNAEAVHQSQNMGVLLEEKFPVDDWEMKIGRVRLYGVLDEEQVKRPVHPPSPGKDVMLANEEIISRFLGLQEGGLNIGKVMNHDVDVKLNPTALLQKHLAILAMSGAGKSYLTSVIIEELLEKTKLSVILIDVHGEYLGFGDDPNYMDKVIIIKDFKIPIHELNAIDFNEFIPRMTPAQRRELSLVIEKMRREMVEGKGPYGKGELIEAIKKHVKENTAKPLISWINELPPLFSKTGIQLLNYLRPGKLTIVDLSGCLDLREKQMIVYFIAKKAFEFRVENKVPPFVLIVEEAHNFAREKEKDQISKGIIEKIAREGRKFGACLCLISQRPIHLSTTALSQCNTHIIMRVTNPYDLKHIGESCEGIDKESLDALTTLRVGEALIVGEAVSHPVFVKVRRRKSKKLEAKDLMEMIDEFVASESERIRDASQFV